MGSYYNTGHWREFSERVREENPFCETCGVDADTARAEERPLQVHHLNYDNIGQEEEEDVEVLCKECHENEHGRKFDDQKYY